MEMGHQRNFIWQRPQGKGIRILLYTHLPDYFVGKDVGLATRESRLQKAAFIFRVRHESPPEPKMMPNAGKSWVMGVICQILPPCIHAVDNEW
jgi:hypothetical protein